MYQYLKINAEIVHSVEFNLIAGSGWDAWKIGQLQEVFSHVIKKIKVIVGASYSLYITLLKSLLNLKDQTPETDVQKFSLLNYN